MHRRLADVRKGIAAVRRFLDPPLDADAPAIEIRAAALEAIERQMAVVGIGQRVVPHRIVAVRVLLPDPADRAVFERVFDDFDDRVRGRFGEMRCELPDGFAARVTLIDIPPSGWAAGQRFAIEGANTPHLPRAVTARIPVLAIHILRGDASKRDYRLQAPLVFIGRTAAARDTRGSVRRNHIAFAEGTTGVSRAHARIVYDFGRREYRLIDDGSAQGTRVVRGETIIDVRPRRQDARGVRLEAGDEIHLADAALRITFG